MRDGDRSAFTLHAWRQGRLPAVRGRAGASAVAPDAKPAPAPRARRPPGVTSGSGAVRYWNSAMKICRPDVVVACSPNGCCSTRSAARFAGWQNEQGPPRRQSDDRAGRRRPSRSSSARNGRGSAPTNAAFANAELTNALDFDAIPHLPPVTIPPYARRGRGRPPLERARI